MRFFDEDNKRFEKTLVGVMLIVVIYVGGFLLIRSRTSHYDDCSLEWVDFPTGAIRTSYRPLINLDKMMHDNVLYRGEVDEVRFAQRHYCGE